MTSRADETVPGDAIDTVATVAVGDTADAVDTVETDLLIVGSGFAGLWAAIAARDAGVERVALVDKADIARSSQSRMSAGVTVYLLPDDDLDTWVRDVVEAQQFLCRQEHVTDMLATSHSRLQRLESWGVRYATADGEYFRLPSRGFRHLRMLVRPEYHKREGGAAPATALREQVVRRRCALHPRLFVTELLLDGGRVGGAVAFDRSTGAVVAFDAGAVVLAAGDCSFGGQYACVESATGDAFALAYDAGARLSNMEFLCTNTASPDYNFEGTGVALRFGGRFVNAAGEAFMARHHPDADAAEIAYLVQAMAREVEAGQGPPFALDLRGAAGEGAFLPFALRHMGGFMPLNLERLVEAGVDLFGEPQEWVPALQSLRGGVRTDADCSSELPGLFAAGTAQALDPGLFNGWSTMRAMWSGERAGASAAVFLREASRVRADPARVGAAAVRATEPLRRTGLSPGAVLDRLQSIVFPYEVSILKRESALRAALAEVERLERDEVPRLAAADPHELARVHETANMVRVARLYLLASLTRTESRGDHCRADFPLTDNSRWLRWVNLRRDADADGVPLVEAEPVPFERYRFRPDTEACEVES